MIEKLPTLKDKIEAEAKAKAEIKKASKKVKKEHNIKGVKGREKDKKKIKK